MAYAKSIGPVTVPTSEYHLTEIMENALYMPNNTYAGQAEIYLKECMEKQDSSGGVVECTVHGMPAGIGEPVFEKLDAVLAKAVMSIGAVKGVEIGDGFQAATSHGSINNDAFTCENGSISKLTNHSGGILGGMSDGSDIVLRAAFKPTPSISQVQQTVTTTSENIDLSIHGRHDPIIVPRAVVVVESMVALTLIDLLFANMSSRLDKILSFYKR